MLESLEQDAAARVFVTDELSRRLPKRTDYLQEKRALQELARQMIDDPSEVLPRLVDLAIKLCDGVSGGISLFEEHPAPGVFRWHYLRGDLTKFNGATTPRNFSPCGVCLDQRNAVLVQRPERIYTWLSDANVSLPECLLVPLYIGGSQPLGTLWIVSGGEEHFDNGHARVMAELAGFVSIALSMVQKERRLQEALELQERLTNEMSHRVLNLFSVTQAMISISARATSSSQELAQLLSGRLSAFARAHALVRNSFAVGGASSAANLQSLLQTILSPHDRVGSTGGDKFHIAGPDVQLGERAVTGLALVFHEFATNAVKYGALKADTGSVEVKWRLDDGHLVVLWRERGGQTIESQPSTGGFGSKLVRDTVSRQFSGKMTYDWQPSGVLVTLSIPVAALSS